MSGIINIILGAVVLFVVVVLFLWVSSKHKESGLGDTCKRQLFFVPVPISSTRF